MEDSKGLIETNTSLATGTMNKSHICPGYVVGLLSGPKPHPKWLALSIQGVGGSKELIETISSFAAFYMNKCQFSLGDGACCRGQRPTQSYCHSQSSSQETILHRSKLFLALPQFT